MTTEYTRIAIVGGGPAGLLLSHLLHLDGVDNVVLESRSRDEIYHTQRAGIIEQGAVNALVNAGIDRVLTDGDRHDGIFLRFDGEMHHVDFPGLTGRSVYLYPQTEVFADLSARRAADGGDVRWEHTVTRVSDAKAERPSLTFTDASGAEHELQADLIVGADGSHSAVRHSLPEGVRRTYAHEYPYGWFGIICEAPRSASKLVYNESDDGFALISQRTQTHQRMYLQCDPDDAVEDWSDARIWDEFARRLNGADGFALKEGPIVEKAVLRFRSSVQDPVRHGRIVLVGDACHTVPPTGAKGLNLAIGDVVVLHQLLGEWLDSHDDAVLDEYGRRSTRRVWRAQHFSAWMSRMLHTLPGEPAFERHRRRAELRTLVESESGRRFLAEGYTGWGDLA